MAVAAPLEGHWVEEQVEPYPRRLRMVAAGHPYFQYYFPLYIVKKSSDFFCKLLHYIRLILELIHAVIYRSLSIEKEGNSASPPCFLSSNYRPSYCQHMTHKESYWHASDYCNVS